MALTYPEIIDNCIEEEYNNFRNISIKEKIPGALDSIKEILNKNDLTLRPASAVQHL